jgi:hypothetical protein
VGGVADFLFDPALFAGEGYGVAPEREFTIVGVFALALGFGSGIAALASYLLSRSFGLLQRGSHG